MAICLVDGLDGLDFPDLLCEQRTLFLPQRGEQKRRPWCIFRLYNNRLLVINLCRLALGGQTVKNLRLLASKFELDQSQRKSLQVHASGWSNETQVQNLRRLASPFCQGFMTLKINTWYFWCSSSDIFCV